MIVAKMKGLFLYFTLPPAITRFLFGKSQKKMRSFIGTSHLDTVWLLLDDELID